MIATDTKTALLDEGTRLFLERGYHATGIQDVLTAAGVPKGSFYHHFRSKEDFGLQIVNRYGEAALEQLDEMLSDPHYPPLQRVQRFFEAAFAQFTAQGCRYGCLMGKLGQELAEVNDAFRENVAYQLKRWAERIAQCLFEAVDRGELPTETNPQELGKLLIDGFQGAALRMKLERRSAPLQRFMNHYFGSQLAS